MPALVTGMGSISPSRLRRPHHRPARLQRMGSITIIVPRDVGVQVTRHRGGVDSRLEPPVPGLPLIRLDVTANIGKVRLRHPGTQDRSRRWPGSRHR
jgi:hypothetical protein